VPTSSVISAARPAGSVGTVVSAAFAALLCAAMLIGSDGTPAKIAVVAWAGLVVLACLPITLYFRGTTERLLLLALAVTLSISLKVHLLYRTEHIGGAIGLRVSITEVLLGCLLVACTWRLANSPDNLRVEIDTPILKAMLAYLACAATSTLLGSNFDLGFYQLVAVLQAFFVFVFVTNYVSSAERLRTCIVGVVLSLALQSAVAIVQVEKPGLVNLAFLGAEEQTEETVVAGDVALPNVDKGTTKIAGQIEHRPSGLLIHPNVLAAYLVLSIPVAAGAWAIANSMCLQLLCLVSAGAGGAALYFSLSRSGWAGMALALCLIAGLYWKLPLLKPTPGRKLIIVLAVAAGVAGLAVESQRIYLRLTESAGDAVKFRSDLASTAWNMTKAHPFFGTGFNSFTEVMADYDTTGMSRLKKFPAHNVYLLELSEGGFSTGLAFLGLVGVIILRVFQVSGRSGSRALRTVAVFTACGICGFWLTQVSDYVYRIPILTTLVWFHVGLVYAAANLRESVSL